MGKKSRVTELPAATTALYNRSAPRHHIVSTTSFRCTDKRDTATPLPPQFDTTNSELVFYGSLEYITLPEYNNNGDTSIKRALCIHCVIKLIST